MDFKFTIQRLKDGIPMTLGEMERVLLAELEESNGTSLQSNWNLAVLYSRTGRPHEAIGCVERLRALSRSDEEQVQCLLGMGQLHEQLGDFHLAARFYREGLEVPTRPGDFQYWLNNNLAYSLIQLGRASEVLALLEAAVAIDSARPNAHKNMGLAHQQLGEFGLAAQCFVRATRADASDGRALKHLEEIVAAHPEVLVEAPGLGEALTECRKAVAFAAAMQPDERAHWEELRAKVKPD